MKDKRDFRQWLIDLMQKMRQAGAAQDQGIHPQTLQGRSQHGVERSRGTQGVRVRLSTPLTLRVACLLVAALCAGGSQVVACEPPGPGEGIFPRGLMSKNDVIIESSPYELSKKKEKDLCSKIYIDVDCSEYELLIRDSKAKNGIFDGERKIYIFEFDNNADDCGQSYYTDISILNIYKSIDRGDKLSVYLSSVRDSSSDYYLVFLAVPIQKNDLND